MAGFRKPGPMCVPPGPFNGKKVSNASSPSTVPTQPGPAREFGLTPKQQELALDVAQLILDIAGIFEPTPFADGTNALISLGRGQWLDAGLSGLGIIPYLGDLAKVGKLPRYAAKIQQAIDMARHDANFAKYLRPALQKLRDLLNTIPVEQLSPRLASLLASIKKPLDSFLGTVKGARRVWWEVLDVGPIIKGTSIPEWIKLRVNSRQFQVMRNKAKLDKAGKPIGPATKHLAEKATDANEWAKLSQVDFPMSSLAAALEQAEKKLLGGKAKSGDIFTVEAWELGINTTKNPWVVYHAVYNPKIKP